MREQPRPVELLTVEQLASALRISKATAYRLIARGLVRGVRLSPRCLRIPASEVLRLIREATGGLEGDDGDD
ncbi:MAG: helix-turn-helix domain-containing protein [Armatimonadota bacterium]|nr:helix-turn-helix domain-containing protein [Armatimonadota bacterium]MDR7444798.1 helix-turn-helix domain-containing protein [Armatimonadota bacterium]MDR7569201.1 helix-turn-helix domain-containing protein [Armatimonadota bacterium]MDR7613319.1 helix-turn-helix domain-containing protein [Armatimonadota bacterium]